MLRFTAMLPALIAALIVLAPKAMAQACTGRPGASAIEQYCEAIPEGTGERVGPSGSNGSSGKSSGSGISQSTSRELDKAGADGQAVLAIAAAGGGDDQGGRSGGSETSGGSQRAPNGTDVAAAAAQSPSDNPLKAVSSSVSNGSTVGSGFLWGLLALAVAAAAAAWVGFRRGRQPPTDE